MFNSSKTLRVAHVLGQVVPQLSVFAWGPQVAPKLTANQKKAAELRSSFVSPFDQVRRLLKTINFTQQSVPNFKSPWVKERLIVMQDDGPL